MSPLEVSSILVAASSTLKYYSQNYFTTPASKVGTILDGSNPGQSDTIGLVSLSVQLGGDHHMLTMMMTMTHRVNDGPMN